MNLKFNGNYFEQTKVMLLSNVVMLLSNVVNIYVVYELDPISSTRNTDYTLQNALIGAVVKILIFEYTDISKNNYEGYGTCFDEGSTFSHTLKKGNFSRAILARNVLIFWCRHEF